MRVNNGLTPQDLKAYGINDVGISFITPATILCMKKSSPPIWKAMNVAY